MLVAEEFVIKLKDIKRYKDNNKVHTEANIDQIAKSIEQFGYLSRIGVDENYELLYGEGRYLALLKLEWDEVPIHVIKHLSEAQKREFRILDNKISDLSFYDTTAIQKELDWLVNNDYEGMLSDLMGEVDKSPLQPYADLNEAIEEAQGEFMDKMNYDYKKTEPAVKTFTKVEFNKGDTVVFRSATIIIGDMPEMLKGFIFTNDSLVANANPCVLAVCDDPIGMYKDFKEELLVWHKGVVSEEGELVQNNCLSLVRIKGEPLQKRRFNNLITAIPNKETPNKPPVVFFEDILQNFIKPGTKCYTNVYNELAIAGSATGYPVTIYVDSSDDVNDILFLTKTYLGLRSMEVKVNGEVILF